MKKILTLTLILLNSTLVFSQFENITDFQKKLIEEEITGSNVAMVYQNGEIINYAKVSKGFFSKPTIINESIFIIDNKMRILKFN